MEKEIVNMDDISCVVLEIEGISDVQNESINFMIDRNIMKVGH